MYLGRVVTVTVNGIKQQIHLDDGSVLCYNDDAFATVNRDGVILNVRVNEICDDDKLLVVIDREDFAPPTLKF